MNYLQQLTLFDRKFVNTTLRSHYRCPKCQNEFLHNFQILYGESHVKSNRPFLLPCGHDMCENCIFQNRSNLACSICMRPVEIPMNNLIQHSQFFVRDFFEMNFFLLGAINFFSFNRRSSSNNNTLQTTSITPIPSRAPAMRKCNECENSPAVGVCKQCKDYYCNFCFVSVHKNSKVLKAHKLESWKLEMEEKKFQRAGHLPKPRMCHRHHKICERFCKKCDIVCCIQCVKTDHGHHGYTTILEQNEKVKDDIYVLLETIKNSRESVKKAQKDVRSTEKQLHEYAIQTVHDISKSFLELHSFLQLEERRILDEFQELCQRPQKELRDVFSTLAETQNKLNTMHSNIEYHQRKLPSDILMHEVIAATSIQLEQLPCQVRISKGKLNRNPFTFHIQSNFADEFSKSMRHVYDDPQLGIRIGPIYGDLNRSLQETSLFEDTSPKLANNKKRNNARNQKKKKQQEQNFVSNSPYSNGNRSSPSSSSSPQTPTRRSNMSAIGELMSPLTLTQSHKFGDVEYVARISHVHSPEHFYIQQEKRLRQIKELSNKYVSQSLTEMVPQSISEGSYYMAYYTEEKLWYRAIVKKIVAKDLYKMFLIDIGLDMELPRQRLCDIDDSALALPYAAIRCAIHNIIPAGGAASWPEEAKQLLVEITNNKPVCVNIIEQIKNSIWKVDLITTHTAEPISLRDSFLYAGLAQERPGSQNFKLQPKKMSPTARIHQRLQKLSHQQGEMLMVQMCHIEDPQEFFVIKLDQNASKQQMLNELNSSGESLHKNQIYLGALQMCCALKLRDSWHRACIEEIKPEGKIRVRLVDEGLQEIVDWNQLFVLPDKFRQNKEFAIQCALADIEPLQENNYTWTEEAIHLFKQLCGNPTLQLFIYAAKSGQYKVSLHVSKKHIDVNIGAMLVKYGHATSTGEATHTLEVIRTPKKSLQSHEIDVVKSKERPEPDNEEVNTSLNASKSTGQRPDIKILKRTPVYVRHIESPGEFYIALKQVEAGIRSFHQRIQETESQRQQLPDFSCSSDSQTDYKNWFVGDHCIVHTNFECHGELTPLGKANNHNPYGSYYRGIIVSIELEPNPQAPFVVFLRDVGAKVYSIRKTQLRAIDHQLDRVTNAVQQCHLACVQPTGGVKNWSQTSIECFKGNVQRFRNLGITLQGDSQPNSKSIPVVLWGMTTETADPLAPCISKYANINRILVNAGLAHLVERLDVTKQMDRIIEQDLQEGEITIEEWFQKFAEKNKAMDVIENASETTKEENYTTDDDIMTSRLDLLQELNTDTEQQEQEHEPMSTTVIAAAIATAATPVGWPKCKPTSKSIFTAYPTYVDYDAVIYLHDATEDVLLKKMRAKLQVYADKPLPNESKIEYTAGKACLAKYHVDNYFHRAIVNRVLPDDSYYVIFVDYGNVEHCKKSELRPFAPFPKLPVIASKYRIDGICPKGGDSSFPTKVLDIMHAMVVGKLVSVRVPTTEMQKDIKSCSIRVGADDLAELLIAQGLVDADKRLPILPTDDSEMPSMKGKGRLCMRKIHPLQDFDDEDLPTYSPSAKVVSKTDRHLRNSIFADIEKKLNMSQRQKAEDSDLDEQEIVDKGYDEYVESNDPGDDLEDELDERFNAYLSQIDKDELEHDSDVFSDLKTIAVADEHTFLPPPPPAKKRMFDLEDYKKIQQQLQTEKLCNSIEDFESFDGNIFESGDVVVAHANTQSADAATLEEDEDVVELEYSFASNYWHTADTDIPKMTRKLGPHLSEKLDKGSASSNNELESSGFERFQPCETSSAFSHISGIEFFKTPRLPTGMRSFFCKVAAIITPVVLHIFPHLAELEYRETELERRIQHLARKAQSLTSFEPNSVCLACYSKDKKWYRAIIRSHNLAAKTADVFYVDYLNTESIPLKSLRQYPMELTAWPLRTFQVRLAGLQPNPRMREKDVRRALYNIVAGRILHARIAKSDYKCTAEDEFENGGARFLQEISLYESKKAATSMVIYEELILENFYFRI